MVRRSVMNAGWMLAVFSMAIVGEAFAVSGSVPQKPNQAPNAQASAQPNRPQGGGGRGSFRPGMHHEPKFCKEEHKTVRTLRMKHGLCIGKAAREYAVSGNQSADCVDQHKALMEGMYALAKCVKAEREAAKAAGDQPAPEAEKALEEATSAPAASQ
jgi:hypothetical protein